MKKFILGLVSGLIIAGCSAVYASDNLKALLFSANYEINGGKVELPNGYHTLNVDGHAYVPVRFISENMGADIDWYSDTKTISVNSLSPYEPIYTDWEGYYPQFKVGNVKVSKVGNDSKVTGSFSIQGEAKSSNSVAFSLTFYNEDGEELGRVGAGDDIYGGEVKSFEAISKGVDLSQYSKVKMELGIFDHVIKRNKPNIPDN